MLFLVTIESSVRIWGSQQETNATPETGGFSAPPIAFSHRQHVGEFGLDCQLCHVYARRGPVAGIPSVARWSTSRSNVPLPKGVTTAIRPA